MPIRGAPGTGLNTIRSPLLPSALDAGGMARVTQQFLEVIDDGGSGTNAARITVQYLEVIHSFGTAPLDPKHGNGKGGGKGGGKDNAPGQNKTGSYFGDDDEFEDAHHNLRRSHQPEGFAFPPPWIVPLEPLVIERITETITISDDGIRREEHGS